jgi:hypothetical protein
MTTMVVPLLDTGDGAEVAHIQIEGPPVSWHQMCQLAEILGRARVPIHITFAPYGPPPEFLSRQDVARVLGTTDYHVRKLTQAGHLTEILYNEGYAKERPPMESANGELWPNPGDPATRRVYRYSQVLDVARQAVATGHLPVVAKERLARSEGPLGWEAFKHVLVEARKPLTKEEIRERVNALYAQRDQPRPITRSLIDKYVTQGLKTHTIHNTAPRVVAGKQPAGRYRWGPEPKTGETDERD